MKQELFKIIPSCCEIDFLKISECSLEEQKLIHENLSETKTIIVLAHHVKASLEWIWYPHKTERGNNTCGADLHAKLIMDKIHNFLQKYNFKSFIVPYPGRCGIKMKELASKTGLGELGDNFMFLHKEWGPWVHLRVLFTDAKFDSKNELNTDVCIHCGKCLSACPAKAIREDSFDGIACGEYQASQCNSIPDNYYWKCEICARICPIGNPPVQLKIIKNNK